MRRQLEFECGKRLLKTRSASHWRCFAAAVNPGVQLRRLGVIQSLWVEAEVHRLLVEEAVELHRLWVVVLARHCASSCRGTSDADADSILAVDPSQPVVAAAAAAVAVDGERIRLHRRGYRLARTRANVHSLLVAHLHRILHHTHLFRRHLRILGSWHRTPSAIPNAPPPSSPPPAPWRLESAHLPDQRWRYAWAR